jgi:uncharacterized SAM-binding protein YcdF (DUF218 family)
MAGLGGLGLVLMLLVVVLVVCWIILPFAIIGTKPLLICLNQTLEQLLAEAKETNKLLRAALQPAPIETPADASDHPKARPSDNLAPDLPPPHRY